MTTKLCPVCEVEFVATSNRQKYCGPSCRDRRFGEGDCAWCSSHFIATYDGQRFCGAECWYQHKRNTGFRACPVCRHKFKGPNKTCSAECGYELRKRSNPRRRATCENCGKPLGADVKPGRRFCSVACSNEASAKAGRVPGGNALPIGTRRPAGCGYVRVKVADGWTQEHRHIMEVHLGRPLRSSEYVHHKNGIRHDNSLDNLEVCIRGNGHPPGQRIDDVLDLVLADKGIRDLPDGVQKNLANALERIFKL